jgi:hypothetical protein
MADRELLYVLTKVAVARKMGFVMPLLRAGGSWLARNPGAVKMWGGLKNLPIAGRAANLAERAWQAAPGLKSSLGNVITGGKELVKDMFQAAPGVARAGASKVMQAAPTIAKGVGAAGVGYGGYKALESMAPDTSPKLLPTEGAAPGGAAPTAPKPERVVTDSRHLEGKELDDWVRNALSKTRYALPEKKAPAVASMPRPSARSSNVQIPIHSTWMR